MWDVRERGKESGREARHQTADTQMHPGPVAAAVDHLCWQLDFRLAVMSLVDVSASGTRASRASSVVATAKQTAQPRTIILHRLLEVLVFTKAVLFTCSACHLVKHGHR